MFQKKEEPVQQNKSSKDELKELLLAEGNNTDEQGIVTIAKSQLTSDLHQRKIARVIEILENL